MGTGSSYQYVQWHQPSRTVRIFVYADPAMNTSRCLDGAVDWQQASGHYDIRVVRVCRPGASESTDPGGDGAWSEPAGWDGVTIHGVRSAGGINIADSYPFKNKAEDLSPASSGRPYQSTSNVAPRTAGDVDFWARIRTRYENGDVLSFNKTPEHCFGKGDWPWNCN